MKTIQIHSNILDELTSSEDPLIDEPDIQGENPDLAKEAIGHLEAAFEMFKDS